MIEHQLDGIGMTSARTRERMVTRLIEQDIRNWEVLDAIRTLPRHFFVDEALAHRAYEDTALPIGYQQTISQPYVVARMTERLVEGRRLGKVLEIGTGSGYQTAVLAQLVEHVYSLERIRPLHDRARHRLNALKIYNVFLRHADGGMGWPDKGPYDGILVTASPERVPPELFEQLAEGGRLVIPLGPQEAQVLHRYTKVDGQIQEEVLEAVRFVPLVKGLQR